MIEHTPIKHLLKGKVPPPANIIVKGWVRTIRTSKNVNFIALNDGSTILNIQLVIDSNAPAFDTCQNISTGACIRAEGTLVASQGKGQSVEIQCTNIEIYGSADNTFGAVLRMRHQMAFAIHQFFNNKGFFYMHSPIVTGSDAEGAGEMFKVTTLPLENPPRLPDGSINYMEDFFGKATNLTVSGQLEAELGALALGNVYTFGPTFRAENSNTPRHLAEFWMIEPEMAFYDIHDNMDLAEEMLKYLINYALENSKDDLEFLNQMYDKELIARLQSVVEKPFVRLTYTQAVDILIGFNDKFEFKVEWGTDLQKEHENFLVSHHGGPVILTDYPKHIKAFYMKQNDDGKTVRAMDILFPWIGEIIGGSQREENYDKLLARVTEMGIDEDEIWWYLDTRRFGTCPHAGFGLGFERLMLFVTGMTNIRDVIPFPRTPKNAEF
jgi:asparaginyl-tRNA synthetase